MSCAKLYTRFGLLMQHTHYTLNPTSNRLAQKPMSRLSILSIPIPITLSNIVRAQEVGESMAFTLKRFIKKES